MQSKPMPFVATGIDSSSRHVLISHGHERAAHAEPSELVRLSLSGKLDQRPGTRDQRSQRRFVTAICPQLMRAFVALRRCMSIDLTYVCDVVMYDSWRSLSWTSARVGLGLSGMYLYVDSTYHLRGRGADEGSKHRSTRPPVPSRTGSRRPWRRARFSAPSTTTAACSRGHCSFRVSGP